MINLKKSIILHYLSGFILIFLIVPLTEVLAEKGIINITIQDTTFPNPRFTPGDSFKNSTKERICTVGYTTEVRNVSITTKKKVFEEYSIPYPPPSGAYEIDHFIPLELGGDNDIKNLWPQPSLPFPGFHDKDIVENYLHYEVCSKGMLLEEAQREITTNWFNVYKRMSSDEIVKFNYNNKLTY